MSSFYKALASVAIGLLLTAGISSAAIVNIDAALYGHSAFDSFSPAPGGLVTPVGPGGNVFSGLSGGVLDQLTLGAGTYSVTNATGSLGANTNFTGWNFDTRQDQETDPSWVWSAIIANDATHVIVSVPNAGGAQASPAAIAAQPDVQDFSATFTLAATTTLDFMVNDYGLGDNAGGISLNIQSLTETVPEPSSFILCGLGAIGLLVATHRCRQRRCGCQLGREPEHGGWRDRPDGHRDQCPLTVKGNILSGGGSISVLSVKSYTLLEVDDVATTFVIGILGPDFGRPAASRRRGQ
jgi:hypothetical protein